MTFLRTLREDMQTVLQKDPAARSTMEVLLCYPGLHALWLHRLAHGLWRRRHYLVARMVSQFNRTVTGIEIHPAAHIGRRFFIDHGMGVVIGETAEIGDDVLLYKGVVLGGTSLEKVKRHPTLGNGVIVGSNAVVLGAIKVGDNAKIGSGAVVVRPVPPNATVVGVPGRIVAPRSQAEPPHLDLDHARLPDPIVDALRNLETRMEALERAASLPIGQCPIALNNGEAGTNLPNAGSSRETAPQVPSLSETSPRAAHQAPAER